ncbi:MAG: indolepyruvate ferredoxin oxidoreductase family protein [Paracoccaceae bacterium]|nr:indolepyruvate ferredoxin oxidoreductase family protein [Paracoccaceae bacterium]
MADLLPNRGDGLRPVDLAQKFDLSVGQVYLTGTQALVRMCLMQAARDRMQGLQTAGYVTGYRGSPLGALDQQFQAAAGVLQAADVRFHPALNEDLAATAIWGTQQVAMRGEGTHAGVFGLWYGKGPGVDRSGDVLRHGNLAGSAAQGGVLALLGDDHTCESSTTCHQSEYALVDAMMPVLNPANLAELVTFGLHGWALSRYSGLWVGLKCVKDTVESSGSVDLPLALAQHLPVLPDLLDMPAGGLNIRPKDDRHDQERRLHRFKLDAARAYARANGLDRVIWPQGRGGPARIGIVSTGKSHMDVLQALHDLGMDQAAAKRFGLSLYKVGMVWPLEPDGLRDFADGLDLLIVVEEKRGLIEGQLREILYGTKGAPTVIGKRDETGARLFVEEGALDQNLIAQTIGHAVLQRSGIRDAGLEQALARLSALRTRVATPLGVARAPYFCAGCPHNSSTVLPQGARGYAGIGCHWMSQFMGRATEGHTHMGGEGANWIGEAPFSTRRHVFQNLGDGTYNHSGLMAIRAAVAAGVNITYKILYNDAVAMTGGQAHEGALHPTQIAAEVLAAGVVRLTVVSDNPKALRGVGFPNGVTVSDRADLQSVQTKLAEIPGVTVLIYEQTCATEKRRRRKRAKLPDPPARAFINAAVCEGCGDCGVQSNCVAIVPLDTELGRKRQIDQSACNTDLSCLKGFCPSFVTVEGGRLHRPSPVAGGPGALPEPQAKITLDRPVGILLTGVGGTGVVTIGALLGMAAHLEGKGCGLIDMAGLAQKGGAVTTHIRLAAHPNDISALRIAPGGADLLLGCDGVVSAGATMLSLLSETAHVVANTHEMMTGAFVRDADFQLPSDSIAQRLRTAVPPNQAHLVDATRVALALFGDTIAANPFLLGLAYQLGLIPLSAAAIRQAIVLNNVAVTQNLGAFDWGRAYGHDPVRVRNHAFGTNAEKVATVASLDGVLADRAERLTQYQNAGLAAQYRQQVTQIAACDHRAGQPLALAFARNLYKLMAYKDEYEVARLYSAPAFRAALATQFEGRLTLRAHLAPPGLSPIDPATGRPKKRSFGPWIWPALRLLAKCRGLRGSWADPFGYSAERRLERALPGAYSTLMGQLCQDLGHARYDLVLELAQLPEQIRGFGPVKEAAIATATKRQSAILAQLNERRPIDPQTLQPQESIA